MLPSKSSRIYPCRLFALLVLSWIMLLIIPGCSLRYAGAPTPSYNVDDDFAQLADQFKVSSSVSEYYKIASPTQKDRNKVISGRLVMIDIQYLKWLRTMTADQQLLNTSTDALVISLSLAAMITGGDTAKALLSALAAGVTGVKTSIDKHYYYDKTMPALASAMNAQRKTVLVQIINGMNKPLEEYSFEQGLSDLNDYYQAGTLMGAVTAIQADAGVKAQAASEEIKRLIKPTSGETQAVDQVKNVIEKIKDELPDSDKAILYSALASLGIDEESRYAEFLDSKISYENRMTVNLVTFELYDDTTEPKKIILQKKDIHPPGAEKPFWEGIMVAGNELVVVSAYRES